MISEEAPGVEWHGAKKPVSYIGKKEEEQVNISRSRGA